MNPSKKRWLPASRELRLGLWWEISSGFYHSYLLLCSYNSPLYFGVGTRLTVTGMGSCSRLGVPVLDHDDQLLGGKWGVRTGSELPSLLECKAFSTL